MENIASALPWIAFPLLILHVASGFVGMYAGFVPAFVQKGSAVHRRWGLVFVWGMGLASATAFPLAYWHADLFQAAIGLLTGYLVFMTVRSVRPSRSAAPLLDWVFVIAGLLSFCALIGAGVFQVRDLPASVARASLVFGAIGLLVGLRHLRALTAGPRSFRQRVIDHVLASCLAVVCGVASFLNTQLDNLTGLEWPLDWRMLVAVVFATPLLTYAVVRWSRRLKGVNSLAELDRKPGNSDIAIFRFFARAEGASLLVLVGLAVPLKHLADTPELVSLMGPIHGALFVLYVISVMLVRRSYRWSIPKVSWALFASMVPGGTFVFEAMLTRDEEPKRGPRYPNTPLRVT